MGWPQGWPVAARTWGRTNQAWSSLGKRFMASRWPGPVRLSPKGFWQAAISKADPQVLQSELGLSCPELRLHALT